jgi:hypothetical protein
MPKATKRIPFVMRLHFLRDAGSIEVQHTFIWEGDPDRDFPKSLALAAPMPAAEGATVLIGGDAQAITVKPAKDAKVGLSQTSAEYYRVWKSERTGSAGTVAEGRRAPGWVDVSNGRWGVTAVVWRSWQNYPKGFHADLSTGQLHAFLWPPEAGLLNFRRYAREWGVGETGARGGIDPGAPGGIDPFALSRHVSRGAAKTHRVLFDFHPGQGKPEEIAARAAPFLQKVRAWPPLDQMCRFESLHGVAISPRAAEQYDELEKITDACLDWMLFNQDHFRWYGMLDYGDIQQCFQNVLATGRWENDYGRWGWFNGDASGYKPYSAMLMHFQRTGRRDVFDWFEAEVLHVIDVDMVNCEEYPWNDEGFRDMRGCGHRHNAQHWACFFVGSRSARVDPFKHVYYLTGDERVRDALDVFARQAWLELGVGRGSRGGHSGTQDMASRLLYSLEHTGDEKVRDFLAQNFDYVLNANRGVTPPDENDDLEWVRKPAEEALTTKRDYMYPGTVIPGLANGIRYIQDAKDRERYRQALDQAVDFMKAQYRGGPQGLPPDRWPGEKGGPIQGNWNPIPNFMPLAIHALKLHDQARGGAR